MEPYAIAFAYTCRHVAVFAGTNAAACSGQRRRNDASGRIPRLVMTIFRFAISLGFVVAVFVRIYSSKVGLAVVVSLLVTISAVLSKRLRKSMARIENKFIDNLNERELRRSGKKTRCCSRLAPCIYDRWHRLRFCRRAAHGFEYPPSLRCQCRRHSAYHAVYTHTQWPYAYLPGDVLSVIGTDEQIAAMLPVVEAQLPPADRAVDPSQVKLTNILLGPTLSLIGKTPQSTSLRDTYNALVVAVDRGDEHIDSRPDLVFGPRYCMAVRKTCRNCKTQMSFRY